MEFISADFDTFCIHHLRLLFVALAGVCSDVVQDRLLVQVTGISVGRLV